MAKLGNTNINGKLDVTGVTTLDTPLSVANGGTGANTTEGARNNLGLLDYIYPIGSIYMSVNSTDPGTLFGGTWVAWGSGRVPVGVDTTQTEFNTVEKMDGEKTHLLTTNEMPTHGNHLVTSYQTIGSYKGYLANTVTTAHGTTGRGWNVFNGNEIYPAGINIGGNTSHNNMQPYITCYMWKRTA